ncbi:asparagine synthetase B [Halorubellus sp. JP-L1]|uniref:asparagine synthase C-terminal domain-containing protein n=1 Tax=Halorubellus sp. JP-L1 TaxID=2715753 RepID=UPI0014090C17|nr:asparagine synthetase B [Halorubellus sp. JP-L1]
MAHQLPAGRRRREAPREEPDRRVPVTPDDAPDDVAAPGDDSDDGESGTLDAVAAVERALARPAPDAVADREQAVERVREAIRAAAEDVPSGDADDDARGGADGSLAVAFSGGVDSALVAGLFDAPCYVVGFPGSHDVRAARSAARAMDVDLTVVELDHDALADAVPRVARAIGRENAMAVQIALPLLLVAERVAADGHDRLAVGQGADELFGGYAKVAKAPTDPRVDADTVRGARDEMLRTLTDQLDRDVRALDAADVAPVAPLLDERVIDAARSLQGDLLVSERGERKFALRLAAREWVPDGVAFREKKAVQYGSLVGRELDRLARQAGFKRREDDHVTAYVRSRLRDGDR